MSTIETIAALGLGANMSALAWIMNTLFQLRREISSTHARHDERLNALERVVFGNDWTHE